MRPDADLIGEMRGVSGVSGVVTYYRDVCDELQFQCSAVVAKAMVKDFKLRLRQHFNYLKNHDKKRDLRAKVRSKEKPLACELCDYTKYTCSQMDTLDYHMQTQTTDWSRECKCVKPGFNVRTFSCIARRLSKMPGVCNNVSSVMLSIRTF